MKILIIGGTKFLGRHLITAAQARGHDVTLFNRGKFSSETFENVGQIHGDRNSDLDKLSGRNWDAVIDTCGFLPQSVKVSAEALKDSAGQYVFISSGSVYTDIKAANYDENTPVAELTEDQRKRAGEINPKGELTGPVLGDMYGGLKILCEREAEKAMSGRVLNVRSGMIVGEFDPTDRFTYWVMRVARGGEALAPGTPNRFVQLIDASDLAAWLIKAVEQNLTGIYNATGKPFELTMEKMLEEIKKSSGSDAEFTWVDEDFLARENVQPWSDMPFYLPESDKDAEHFLSMSIDRALQSGIEFRPLSETIRDALAWRKTKNDALKAGISAGREAELLRKWHEKV
ncbi:MAG: NAD-dependent epimerase/dehydratase family protein [Pyrinomonadaceae bacterium]